ncbi:MAG: PQQ-dependent sugar dehydrogenase [Candidatus Sungbacteria bacterium]|nr:PQQ-dependent sugar dehydrogenase [Candidatus Sungbacteria bacterium]
MRKHYFLIIIGTILSAAFGWGASFYWKNLRGIGPALSKPPADIADLISEQPRATNTTGFPLKLPSGFSIEIFAKNLSGARVMVFDRFGNMWVSRTSAGVITQLQVRDGKVVGQNDYIRNLRKPHGLAFGSFGNSDSEVLYYAEENKISFLPIVSTRIPTKIVDLPAGGGHFTRTIGFGPDGRLYISIGSSCNVCRERDQRRAAIYSMNKDGGDFKLFVTGLRNSVFFVWHPETKKMWATEMGRDLIGDDFPPDEINIVEEEKNYGWPACYGNNIHDTDFDRNTYIRNPCTEPFETPSFVDIPAHSAPLGLAFVPDTWPQEYRGNLLVAYHGSWNRSEPTGYKIVRFKFNDTKGLIRADDVISGWLTPDNKALGRPVDLVFGPDNTLYVSDDKAGVIYALRPPS